MRYASPGPKVVGFSQFTGLKVLIQIWAIGGTWNAFAAEFASRWKLVQSPADYTFQFLILKIHILEYKQ